MRRFVLCKLDEVKIMFGKVLAEHGFEAVFFHEVYSSEQGVFWEKRLACNDWGSPLKRLAIVGCLF